MRSRHGNFDVFLCYNSKDREEVEAIRRRLDGAGLKAFMDCREILPGEIWTRRLEEQIARVGTVAVCIGNNGFGPWQQFELETFVIESVNRGCRVIPLFLKSCLDDFTLPWFLNRYQFADFRKTNPDPMEALVRGVAGEREIGPSRIPSSARTVFVLIEKKKGRYQSRIISGSGVATCSDVRLSPDDVVEISGKPRRLEDLLRRIAWRKDSDLRDFHDTKTQRFLGDYLFRQVFGDMKPWQIVRDADAGADIRIVTEDSHIARLPWGLLASLEEGRFLAGPNWTVSLAKSQSAMPDPEPPAVPPFLVVAPDTAGPGRRAMAGQHAEDLEAALARYNPRYEENDALRAAQTWEEFKIALSSFKPRMVYFYGRLGAKDGAPYLVFKGERDEKAVGKDVESFVKLIREAPGPVDLVYLNPVGAKGDVAFDAIQRLADVVPAVVGNHNVFEHSVARAQAMEFWPRLLLDGISPGQAAAEIPRRLEKAYGFHRWLSPLFFCNYDRWVREEIDRPDPLKSDPFWHLKLDRTKQFGAVSYQTREMVKNLVPRILAYAWYGKKDQGVNLFHKRLRRELQNDLRELAHFYEIRPEWPKEKSPPKASFERMLCEAFDASCLQDVPQAIRKSTQGESGRQILVYIRHKPVLEREKWINPLTLRTYLSWMDGEFAKLLGKGHFVLLTTSFVVKNPPKFREVALVQAKLNGLKLEKTVFTLLDEMEKLCMEDLETFLKMHKIPLASDRRERLLQEVLNQTGGNYRQTVDALQQMVRRAANAFDDEEEEFDADEIDLDY